MARRLRRRSFRADAVAEASAANVPATGGIEGLDGLLPSPSVVGAAGAACDARRHHGCVRLGTLRRRRHRRADAHDRGLQRDVRRQHRPRVDPSPRAAGPSARRRAAVHGELRHLQDRAPAGSSSLCRHAARLRHGAPWADDLLVLAAVARGQLRRGDTPRAHAPAAIGQAGVAERAGGVVRLHTSLRRGVGELVGVARRSLLPDAECDRHPVPGRDQLPATLRAHASDGRRRSPGAGAGSSFVDGGHVPRRSAAAQPAAARSSSFTTAAAVSVADGFA